ncbi:MAG: NADH-quinone oxidoreductase subunit NuoB [Deltaproteobacteria bacterium]|nr:NADH-quinone oxidoreductase subunit NuoB [Deltaproteobacteria bacterium]
MFKAFSTRLKQGRCTIAFPPMDPRLPDRYLGRLEIDPEKCTPKCGLCREICPTGAILITSKCFRMDMGKCIFCGDCQKICPENALRFSHDYRLSVNKRKDLIIDGKELLLARQMGKKLQKVLGRSLKLRQVSAGGCGACEADVNVLNTITYDLERFGVQFTASPRHSDGLLITGPVTRNMADALLKTYEAVPEPKIVIAVGACSISGGLFANHSEVRNGCTPALPVDLFIPGCPPHPLTILDGILRLIGWCNPEK